MDFGGIVSLRSQRPTYLRQLSLRNTVSVENDPGGLEAGRLVELNQQFAHHVR